jgi:hypothetical protein
MHRCRLCSVELKNDYERWIGLDMEGNVGLYLEVPLIQFSVFSWRNDGTYSWSPYEESKSGPPKYKQKWYLSRRIFGSHLVKCNDLEICLKNNRSLSASKLNSRYVCSVVCVCVCVCARARCSRVRAYGHRQCVKWRIYRCFRELVSSFPTDTKRALLCYFIYKEKCTYIGLVDVTFLFPTAHLVVNA